MGKDSGNVRLDWNLCDRHEVQRIHVTLDTYRFGQEHVAGEKKLSPFAVTASISPHRVNHGSVYRDNHASRTELTLSER